MADSFTSPTDDIIVQEGVSPYSFKASGTISAGQIVSIHDTMEVGYYREPSAGAGAKISGAIGVAAYDVTDGEYVAVWGPGNIVRCIASGTVSRGQTLFPGSLGKVTHQLYVSGGGSPKSQIGIALESKTNDQTVRVLLKNGPGFIQR